MDLKTSDLNQHISSQFNEELETLRTHVLKMAGLVERNLRTTNEIANIERVAHIPTLWPELLPLQQDGMEE